MPDITQLGYIVFEVSDLAAWRRYGEKVMGLSISRRFSDGSFSFRMDSRESRIFVVPGDADDVVALGFEADGEEALERVVHRLRKRDVSMREGTEEEALARGVEKLIHVREPGGVDCELHYGATRSKTEFLSEVYRSGFVAEELGWGHLALRADDPEETEAFLRDLLGARLSDRILCNIGGMEIDITFLHLNERHHSVALGKGLPKHIHHFMLQVRDLDDLGIAMDRVVDQGFRVVQTLGRHPNDKMISFYSETPSGFQLELGWGGRTITEGWEPVTYPLWTEWGHRPPQLLTRDASTERKA